MFSVSAFLLFLTDWEAPPPHRRACAPQRPRQQPEKALLIISNDRQYRIFKIYVRIHIFLQMGVNNT